MGVDIQNLVREAYLSANPEMIKANTVQVFVDGMKDLEVRAAMRLGHYPSLREALALVQEVQTVRQDVPRTQKLREVLEEIKEVKSSFKKSSGIACQLSCLLKISQMSRV